MSKACILKPWIEPALLVAHVPKKTIWVKLVNIKIPKNFKEKVIWVQFRPPYCYRENANFELDESEI